MEIKTLLKPITLLRKAEAARDFRFFTELTPVNSLWSQIGSRWLPGAMRLGGAQLFYLMGGMPPTDRGIGSRDRQVPSIIRQLHNWNNELNISLHFHQKREAELYERRPINVRSEDSKNQSTQAGRTMERSAAIPGTAAQNVVVRSDTAPSETKQSITVLSGTVPSGTVPSDKAPSGTARSIDTAKRSAVIPSAAARSIVAQNTVTQESIKRILGKTSQVLFDPDFIAALPASMRFYQVIGTELKHKVPGVARHPDRAEMSYLEADRTDTGHAKALKHHDIIKHIALNIPDYLPARSRAIRNTAVQSDIKQSIDGQGTDVPETDLQGTPAQSITNKGQIKQVSGKTPQAIIDSDFTAFLPATTHQYRIGSTDLMFKVPSALPGESSRVDLERYTDRTEMSYLEADRTDTGYVKALKHHDLIKNITPSIPDTQKSNSINRRSSARNITEQHAALHRTMVRGTDMQTATAQDATAQDATAQSLTARDITAQGVAKRTQNERILINNFQALLKPEFLETLPIAARYYRTDEEALQHNISGITQVDAQWQPDRAEMSYLDAGNIEKGHIKTAKHRDITKPTSMNITEAANRSTTTRGTKTPSTTTRSKAAPGTTRSTETLDTVVQDQDERGFSKTSQVFFDPDFTGILPAGEQSYQVADTKLRYDSPGILNISEQNTYAEEAPGSAHIYKTSQISPEQSGNIKKSQKKTDSRQLTSEAIKSRIKRPAITSAAAPVIPQFLNIIPSVTEAAMNTHDTEANIYRQEIGNKSLIASDIATTDIPDIRITQDLANMFWKDEMAAEQIISGSTAENLTARDITYTTPKGLTTVNRNLSTLWDKGDYNTEESSPKPDMLYHIKPDALSSGIIRNTAGILRHEEAQETGAQIPQIPQMSSLPNVARRVGSYESLFYHNRENLQSADNNMQLNTAATASRPVQAPMQTVPQTQVEHKTTSFNKVDMSVKKPPGMSSDITMDPVQMNRLVNQVYEQLERKIFHERRRMGL
ncbi:MAG: hypothetical protein LBD23_19505 [Oscillospiraceae bacterium]|jgi:hypothetical protein|nr:hypothetical protein [Oscillospiraceae bacterium]